MKYKVLLVDDEEIFLDFMQHVISWQAYDCDIIGCAVSGEEAIEKMTTLAPDIVFCDINLSSMSGLDVCARANKDGLLCKIVITTAYDSFSYAREAIKLNVCEYLLKPFDQEELLVALDKCILQIEQMRQQAQSQKERQFSSLLRATTSLPAANELLLPTEQFTISFLRLDTSEIFERQVLLDLLKTHCPQMKNYILGIEKEYLILLQIYNLSVSGILLQKQFSSLLDDFQTVMLYKIAIGSTHNSLVHLKTSYENAMIAYENSIRSEEDIVTYEQTLHHYENGTFYTRDDINRLILCFEQKDTPKVDALLDEIFGLSEKHIFSFQYVVSTFHMVYLEILYHFHLNSTEANHYLKLQKEIVLSLDQCRSTEQVHLLLKNTFLDVFSECSSTENTDKKVKLTQRLDKYLQEHFHESELNINQVADALFYENSYLRKVYKEKTGKTISQALEELRIARAKELLRSDYLQSEIAEQCGFSNQFYFSKRFKQICGCSPSTFKERCKERTSL